MTNRGNHDKKWLEKRMSHPKRRSQHGREMSDRVTSAAATLWRQQPEW